LLRCLASKTLPVHSWKIFEGNIWSERSLMPACKVLVHFAFEFSCHLPCIVTGELYSLMSYINCKMHVKTWSHHFGWGIYQLLQW
jgi:hypothetical protein